MIATFQINLDDASEVTELKDLLDWKLSRIQNRDVKLSPSFRTNRTSSNDPKLSIEESPAVNAQNNIYLLSQFVTQASSNQIEVLKWMKANPGSVSAHILKEDLVFLAPHGALSGVFRPGRWMRLSGGTKEGFPFLQIDWNQEKGCGIYRGLTQEEADSLVIN